MEPKLLVSLNGVKTWTLNGKLHRADGPAVKYPDGTEAWWFDNKRHRVDGPAIVHSNGFQSYYVNGEYIRWGDVLKRITQPGYVLSPLEVSMVEYYLEKAYGA